MFGLTLPLDGWLADACIGRYKMIYCSVWIMWTATILETLNTMIGQLLDRYHTSLSDMVTPALLCLMGIGLGGVLATVVQFGVDQLHKLMPQRMKYQLLSRGTCGLLVVLSLL